MTFDFSPRHHADQDRRRDQSPSVQWPAHVFVAIAMLLVAAAVAVALQSEARLQAGTAIAVAMAVVVVASGIHGVISVMGLRTTSPAPRPKRNQTGTSAAAREAEATPVLADSVGPVQLAIPATVTSSGNVEPTELAKALLACVPSATEPSSVDAGSVRHATLKADGDARDTPSVTALVLSALAPARLASLDAPLVAPPVRMSFDPLSAMGASTPKDAQPETDFQRIDRLVRRLADHVNQVEAAATVKAATAPTRLGVEHSDAPEHFVEPVQLGLFPDTDSASYQLAQSISALRRQGSLTIEPPQASQHVVEVQPPVADPAPAVTKSDRLASIFNSGVESFLALTPAGPDDAQIALRHSIVAALNAQRIDVFLEPILDLAGQRAQHYEVSIGIRTATGQRIDLANTASDLSGTGVLPLIDQTRLTRALEMARKLADRGKTGAVFADLNGETLDDDGFQDAFAEREFVGAFPGQMVLALPQAHVRLFSAADWQTLARLKAAGFAFALSDVTGLDMDFEALVQAGFVFARLDAATFLVGLPMADSLVLPVDICRHMSNSGLALIVGGILEDHQMAKIFGFGVLFGQGRLFGGARPVKAAVTSGSAIAAE
jgi:EAL domain-containing protein (putative c-di-GMP-specific phosphodiesterase class I)